MSADEVGDCDCTAFRQDDTLMVERCGSPTCRHRPGTLLGEVAEKRGLILERDERP